LSPEELLKDIRGTFAISGEELRQLGTDVDRVVAERKTLKAVADLSFLHQIDHPAVNLIKRAAFLPPKALFVSNKIKHLCRLSYRRPDGQVKPCGGFTKNYLGCSQYSPAESEIKHLLQKGNLFLFLQADGLTEIMQQATLLQLLYQIEGYFRQEGVEVIMSFGAGPCRACEACAGQCGRDCFAPNKRRFSLESCGIDVDWAMNRVAKKTSDLAWRLKWIKDFGLDSQVIKEFKSVIGLLLTTG
jgi:predicted metal-binding protein